jgi:Plasmid pRiA4b ORF-3-like protein
MTEVLVKEKDSLVYEYDFGDGWDHKVVLEKILSTTPEMSVPICIAGARACPLENCGGAGGYEALLDAIGDPSHPEHETMLEWVGDDFDPDYFDQARVNDELARISGL